MYGFVSTRPIARSNWLRNGTSGGDRRRGPAPATPTASADAAALAASGDRDPSRVDVGMRSDRLDRPDGVDVDAPVVVVGRVEDAAGHEARMGWRTRSARIGRVADGPARPLAAGVHDEVGVAGLRRRASSRAGARGRRRSRGTRRRPASGRGRRPAGGASRGSGPRRTRENATSNVSITASPVSTARTSRRGRGSWPPRASPRQNESRSSGSARSGAVPSEAARAEDRNRARHPPGPAHDRGARTVPDGGRRPRGELAATVIGRTAVGWA